MAHNLPEILSEGELALLLEQPNVRTISGLRNRVMLEILAHGGLRVGEVINLKPGHVRWETGEVEIKNGKGGRDRVIPLHQSTMDWLHRWNDKRPSGSKFFFTTISGAKAGGRLSLRYPAQLVDRCAKSAGIQDFEVRPSGRKKWKVHPHTLRHTYASSLLSRGYSLAAVQQLLGHSSVLTTSVYLHVNPIDLREQIQGEATREERDLAADELEAAGQKLLDMAAQRRRTE